MTDKSPKPPSLWQEIKRRKVVRVVVAYLLVGWGLIQIADATIDPLRLPEWADTLVVWLVALGLPIAVVLAWVLIPMHEGVLGNHIENDRVDHSHRAHRDDS